MRHGIAPRLIPIVLGLVLAACGNGGGPGASTTGAIPRYGQSTVGPDDSTDEPGARTHAPDGTASPDGTSVAGAELDRTRLATSETPSGWVQVAGPGPCRQAVPPDWLTEGVGIPGDALGPYQLSSSLVSSDLVTGEKDWTAYKAAISATFLATEAVVLDTDELYLIRDTQNGGRSYVLVRKFEPKPCGILLTVDEAAGPETGAIALQILYSMGRVGG